MRSGWAVAAVFLGVVFGAPGARAQVTNTPNTLKLVKTESSPKARIADVAWLAGRWTGDFMGGKGEEVFAPPQGEAFGRGRSLRDRRPVELYIYVGDMDAYHDEVRRNGVRITEPLTTQWWGDRNFAVEDPYGYRLWFTQNVKDFSQVEPPPGVKMV